MSRESVDEIRDGRVYNGFDYALQVWVINGIIQPVGAGRALAGQSIYAIEGAQPRPTLCYCGAEATVTLTHGRKICQSCYSVYEADRDDAQALQETDGTH